MTPIVRQVVDAIVPGSRAHGEAARAALAGIPLLERLASRLGAAQHDARPRAHHRAIVVVVGPGTAATIAAREIQDGRAALSGVARAARTPIVLVDAVGRSGLAGTVELDPAADPWEAGIAVAISLSEPGLDVLAVGALGASLDPARPDRALQVLGGVMLAAASIHVPVILDGPATRASADLAAQLCPHVVDYVVPVHLGAGGIAGLPLFEVGLGHGEGTGAAMILPLVEQVAAVAARC
jgi:hypothetical protein